METMADYRDRWQGQPVTLVGAAVTTVDYRDLITDDTQNIVLVNWAIRIAPLFAGSAKQLHWLTWHMEIFGKFPEVAQLNVTPVVYVHGLPCLPPELYDRAAVYEAVNFPFAEYLQQLQGLQDDGQSTIDRTNQLISASNTTLLALLFIWHAGCREINAIGMHDIDGIPRDHFDPRLNATNGPAKGSAYVIHLEAFCESMGMRLNYVGE